jgi:hypothetical protein
MMIKPKPLLALLAPAGFDLAWHDTGTMGLCLVRPDGVPDLWQRARIHCGTTFNGKYAGRRGDAVGWNALGVSAIRGRGHASRLQKERQIEDPTVFVTAQDVHRWERELEARLPGMLDQLSVELGPGVDSATRTFRQAIDGYEARLCFGTTITELERWLEAQANPAQIVAADRLGTGPAYVPGGVSLYRLAALALIVLRNELEPDQPDFASLRSAPDAPHFV